MREPPKLTDAIIEAVLRTHYGLCVTALAFLPIGNDSASFVYRADTSDGHSYFVKLRTNVLFSQPSLVIPRFCHEQGIAHMVTPLPTVTEAAWVDVGDFILTPYPFIDARTAAEAGLSPEHWCTLGTTLRQIHACELPRDVRQIVQHETFIPWRRGVLDDLEAVLADHALADPIQRELGLFWHRRQAEIYTVIQRADILAKQLRQASVPHVLCHGDLHTWNVLLDKEQQMWLVDWDETIMAPKERDLMFVIGGIARNLVSSQETTCFLQGYGDDPIDRRALAYYRYAWAVQEMGAYAEQVFFSPEASEQTRNAALSSFVDLFAPGNIVDIACTSDMGGQ